MRASLRVPALLPTALLFISLVFHSACSSHYENADLPSSLELGSPRGYQIARTITHFHSPYSWDACDKNGRPGGVVNQECLQHLRDAMCHNRIDFLFLSDHPDAMAQYEFTDLLLNDSSKGDVLTYRAGTPYTNLMKGCSNAHETQALVGFEGKLLGLGMTQHLAGTPDARGQAYGGEDNSLVTLIQDGSTVDGMVFVPHTEGWTIDKLLPLKPNGIEIYNVHANLDPKIRKTYLHLPPFEAIPSVITYLIDPMGSLTPDFMFAGFVTVHPVYFQRWNQLIEARGTTGVNPVGIGASDSHENVFKQKGSDGERLDAHRRLTRFMSNHVLVNSLDPDLMKTALKQGRSWLVFEGFGSPVGMDFSAELSGGSVRGVGETGTLSGGSATLTVKMPTLHHLSPGLRDPKNVSGLSPVEPGRQPQMRIELKRVGVDGADEVVASASGGNLTFQTTQAGAYRAEIYIRPLHLNELLRPFEDLSENEYHWIITNHIYLDP